jgi:hypothetical protein
MDTSLSGQTPRREFSIDCIARADRPSLGAMNAVVRAGFLAFSLTVCACGGATQSSPSYPSSSSSPYGASGSYSAPAMSSPGVPPREQVTAGIVVRPDLLCVPFAVHVIDPDADKAMGIAQGLVGEIVAKFRAVAPTGVLRMRGIAVNPTQGYGKSKEEKEQTAFALVADGVFEMPLADSVDYWARSKLVTTFVALSKKEHDARKDPPITTSFEMPNLRVADPEMHRAKLTKQWVERARAFATAAQSTTTPLNLVDCHAPGDIAQRPISTEEVGLTLAVSCRLDTAPTK